MAKLYEYTAFADAQREYSTAKLWEMFDGTPERFNVGHECIDRWAADPARVAVNIVRAGGIEAVTFREISEQSSRLAHWLVARGIKKGDRVAFMLEPSKAFYVSLFGALKCGAISVPMFTLFGPDGLKLRVNDCKPALLIVNEEKLPVAQEAMGANDIVLDTDLMAAIAGYPTIYRIHHERCRPLRIPIYLGHDARFAGRRKTYASRGGGADDRGALRHWRAPWRPLLLPVLARLGPWAVAWHAGAAGAWRDDGLLRRQVRCEDLCRGSGYAEDHESLCGIHALSHDPQQRCRRAASIRHRETLLYRRADRPRYAELYARVVQASGVQHVWHDGNRRDSRELSRCS